MNLTDQLAAALRAMTNPQNFRTDPTVDTLRVRDEALMQAGYALAAYDACPKDEVKSNRAWREEAQRTRDRNRRLMAIIERLALIPADDFYKPGDYASGLVVEAWREARRIQAGLAQTSDGKPVEEIGCHHG